VHQLELLLLYAATLILKHQAHVIYPSLSSDSGSPFSGGPFKKLAYIYGASTVQQLFGFINPPIQ